MTSLFVSPTMSPVPANSSAPTGRFELDGARGASLEVRVGTHDLAIDDDNVRLDDIDAVAYSSRFAHANLVHRRVVRRLWLLAGSTELRLDLGTRAIGRQDRVREAAVFDAIVQTLHERVEPRLRRRLVNRILDGETVAIGPLALDPAGLSVRCNAGSTSWTWRHAPLAELRGDHVALIDGRNASSVRCRIDATTPHAVMLPELLFSAAAALI